ncbi:unnamed protein product [Cyprideis torosa]|uniref:Uncharacterized protein n=1 Tax=Cyprideis torosa TaxID=163714 RepID=A0A7R8ZK20_9CRUS|nr:unnamed protein product [Cyprideis torosa]CAG0880825.1 unnamed protein product [Cyprideis torosa]
MSIFAGRDGVLCIALSTFFLLGCAPGDELAAVSGAASNPNFSKLPSGRHRTLHARKLFEGWRENTFPRKVQRIRVINLSDSPTCGGRTVQAKIVGGSSVVRGEFPFLVSIRSNGVHFCGGSIISEWYILTAAHCLANRDVEDLSVVVREFDTTLVENEYPDFELFPSLVVVHSKFVFRTYDNDIALIRLSKRLHWDEFTVPVCLPVQRKKVLAGKAGILVGWGRLSENGPRSKRPLKLQVPIVDMQQCLKILGKKNVNPTKFCAGYLEGGRDACQGDSGGPLVMRVGNIYVQEGIISSGVGCARQNMYGLYTRMSEFIPWLKTAMNYTNPFQENFDGLIFEPKKITFKRQGLAPANVEVSEEDPVGRSLQSRSASLKNIMVRQIFEEIDIRQSSFLLVIIIIIMSGGYPGAETGNKEKLRSLRDEDNDNDREEKLS